MKKSTGDNNADGRPERPLVYPLLKPMDSIAVQQGALQRPPEIAAPGADSDMVIAYARDAGDRYEFLTAADLEQKDLNAWHTAAIQNLATLERSFEISEEEDMLFCSGSEFCSEKILDETFMQTAGELLNSKTIFVSIPRRSCMYVIGDKASDETIRKFVFIHGHTREDDSFGNAPVSDLIWELSDGKIMQAKTADRTAYDLHQSRVDEIEDRMRAIACDAVLVKDMGAECIHTGSGDDDFFRIYSTSENDRETIYPVEATIDADPPGIVIENQNVQKGTPHFFDFAVQKLPDQDLRDRILSAHGEGRLRYLFIRLELTPEGKADGVSVKEFNLSGDDSS